MTRLPLIDDGLRTSAAQVLVLGILWVGFATCTLGLWLV